MTKWLVHYLDHELPPWHDNAQELRDGKPMVEGPFFIDMALAKKQEFDNGEFTSGAWLEEVVTWNDIRTGREIEEERLRRKPKTRCLYGGGNEYNCKTVPCILCHGPRRD